MERWEVDPFASAGEMLRALRRRAVSAVELLDAHLARIDRHNPALNAIVTPNFDEARAAAADADRARARGEDRPLLGLPLTIKDCIDVAGLPGTAGVLDYADRRPAADARVVARLRAAGATLIGKTNVSPMAEDWQADNPVFGRTNNPWDLGRTPGGSTGGGAAALAAGLTPLEFGSDIGGSVRVPAAFCGVYGHRPSETAVPRSGHFPGSPRPNPATAMGVQGPLARSAADLTLALDTIAGPEAGEDAGWRLTLPPARHDRLADYRVAVMPPLPWLPVDDAILAAQEHLVAALGRAGARVGVAQPETFGDLRRHHALYLSLLGVMNSFGTPQEDRRRNLAEAERTADEFALASAHGALATAERYIGWHEEREGFRAAFRDFFGRWDILLCPVTLTAAFPHIPIDIPNNERPFFVNGEPVLYGLQLVYPAVATLSGQPATAFPVGLSHAGMPLGLQAIGPYLEDPTTIGFAALVADESGFGGYRIPPGYAADEAPAPVNDGRGHEQSE